MDALTRAINDLLCRTNAIGVSADEIVIAVRDELKKRATAERRAALCAPSNWVQMKHEDRAAALEEI